MDALLSACAVRRSPVLVAGCNPVATDPLAKRLGLLGIDALTQPPGLRAQRDAALMHQAPQQFDAFLVRVVACRDRQRLFEHRQVMIVTEEVAERLYLAAGALKQPWPGRTQQTQVIPQVLRSLAPLMESLDARFLAGDRHGLAASPVGLLEPTLEQFEGPPALVRLIGREAPFRYALTGLVHALAEGIQPRIEIRHIRSQVLLVQRERSARRREALAVNGARKGRKQGIIGFERRGGIANTGERCGCITEILVFRL